MIEYLLPMGALLLASATFSGAEAALFTLGAQGLQRVPSFARPLLEQSVSALTVILFGNLLLNLSYFALATSWARQLERSDALWLEATAILSIIVCGEILPKVLAHRSPAAAGRFLLPPVVALHHVFQRPAGWLGNHWTRPVDRGRPIATDEVRGVLAYADRSMLDAEQHDLLGQVLEQGSLRAGAVRRPLHKMVQVSQQLPLDKAVRQLKERAVAWAAVVDDQGEVRGVLDLTRMPRGRLVADAMREVPILPELAPVAAGVPLLRERGAPFVLLVDEYGVGTGVIERGRWADTLLDRVPAAHGQGYGSAVLELAPDQFLIDANLPLHDFVDRFGEPGEADARVETILGFAEQRLGRLLGPSDAFGFVGPEACFDLKVVRCDGDRPLRLELTVHRAAEEEA